MIIYNYKNNLGRPIKENENGLIIEGNRRSRLHIDDDGDIYKPSVQDIDLAILAYNQALIFQPSGTWKIPNKYPKYISIVVYKEYSGTQKDDISTSPPTGGIQALIANAQQLKQNWLAKLDADADAAAAEAQKQADAARELQEMSTPNSSDDFDYIQNSKGTITIRKYIGKRVIVVIPETISGIKVTEIAGFQEIYLNNNNNPPTLKHITIPNTVTSICEKAFRNQTALSSVVLSNSLSIIPTDMFYGCKSLNDVKIPSSITKINDGAFYECSLNEVVIPNSVTDIGSYAFAHCGLTSVTLGNRLANIGVCAFADNNLTSLQIPASLKIINFFAFYNNKITSLTIPGTVTFLKQFSFGNNPLTSIVIPASLAKLVPIPVETRSVSVMGGLGSITTSSIGGKAINKGDSILDSTELLKGGFRGAFSSEGKNDFIGLANETLTSITLPANVDDLNIDGSMDMFNDYYRNFEESFIN